MGKVTAHMTMSLDGYVADEHDQVGPLFDWYQVGQVETRSANPGIDYSLDDTGADLMAEVSQGVGALVAGRRLFDLARGWGDRHPVGAPVVVVTHRSVDADRFPRTHVAGSVEEAVSLARELAGEKDVVLASAQITAQALDAGLLDEVAVSLVPVLLGAGVPFFGGITQRPVMLEDPVVQPGRRATHLRYPVRRT